MAHCANCGVDIPEGGEILLRGKSKKAPTIAVCDNCAYEIERAFQAETQEPNLVMASLFGMGAGLAAALIWYGIVVTTKYELGIIAILVGWLVGKAVTIGAGKKRGTQLQLLSVGITLLAMTLSEYLVVRYFVVEMLSEEGYTNIPLFLPLGLVLELIGEGLKNNPITLLFWAIALWQAWSVPAARRLMRA